MADVPAENTSITLDDLLAMGSDARVEIIGGELVEMTAAGFRHQIIASNIDFALQSYVRKHEIGYVLPDGMTYLMHSVGQGLKDSYVPDVSFVRHENIPADFDIVKPLPGVPDLAVEIVSPGDDADVVIRKTRTYLAKGTQQVWIVYPAPRELHQYRRDMDTVQVYRRDDDVIDTDDLLPGLMLDVATVFKLPPWATKSGGQATE